MKHEVNEELRRRAAVHAALGDPGRLAIVDALTWGEASPGELGQRLGMGTNLLAHQPLTQRQALAIFVGVLFAFTGVGLAALTEQLLGFTLEKHHSAADWSTRPLPDSRLTYAALDAHANRLAYPLIDLGVGPEVVVGDPRDEDVLDPVDRQSAEQERDDRADAEIDDHPPPMTRQPDGE